MRDNEQTTNIEDRATQPVEAGGRFSHTIFYEEKIPKGGGGGSAVFHIS